jgi:ferredoxin
MSLKTINKEDMASFVANTMSQYAVYGPVARDSGYMFAPLADASQLRLDYTTTILPPKKYLLPQEEVLFTFRTDGMSALPTFDMHWRAIFGVHTCDLHAMALLDEVFARGQPDTHYMKRRATTVIVSVECLAPCDENSFCKSMNTLTASFGYDLHLTDIGDFYAVEVGTTAGEALLTNHGKFHDATRQEIAQLDKALSAKWGRFPRRLDVEGSDLPSLMGISQRSPLWEELGQRCLSCGSCNIVCPTCYCFDVRENVTLDGKAGERERLWDSCQLDEFARVGSGENFRKTRAQRLRHRFMRKGKYMSDKFGRTGCVGCGRCARACLVDITPVGVWNALHKAHAM